MTLPKPKQLPKLPRKHNPVSKVHPAFDPKVPFPVFKGRDGSEIELYPTVFESFMRKVKGRDRNRFELERPTLLYTFRDFDCLEGARLWKGVFMDFQRSFWGLCVKDAYLTYSMRWNEADGQRPCYEKNYLKDSNRSVKHLRQTDYAGKEHLLVDTGDLQPFFFNRSPLLVVFKRFIPKFFPDLLLDDPFSAPGRFEFPYKHINFTYFFIVSHLKDAVAFLDYAEQEKMDFRTFCDFVYNACRCRDERLGRRRHIYILYYNRQVEIYDLMGPDFRMAEKLAEKTGVIR